MKVEKRCAVCGWSGYGDSCPGCEANQRHREYYKEVGMNAIEKLRETAEHVDSEADDLHARSRYQRGFHEGLIHAIGELENNPPVADSHFAEVPEGHVNMRGLHREAIAFIEQLANAWGKDENRQIHREETWLDHQNNRAMGTEAITIYDVARGIINRAKGARDDDGT